MYVGKGNRGSPGTYFVEPGAGEFCLACQHTSMLRLGCRQQSLRLTSLIVLAVSNLLLTFFLLQSEHCASPKRSIGEPVIVARPEVSDDAAKLRDRHEESRICPTSSESSVLASDDENSMRFDVRLGRWDTRRIYRTFDAILVGDAYAEISSASKACLATQSSLEKLHSLVQVAHHWTGPISVALFAAGDEEFEALQRYVTYLRACYAPIRERAIFSLAVPRNRTITRQPRSYDTPRADCTKPEAFLTQIVGRISGEQNSWRARNVYPQNHLRNLARKNCQSDWVFLTDVDIVPCHNMSARLEEFLAQTANECDKCAYVVPTYELDSRIKFPPNKTELVRLARKGLARPFHQKVFMQNQYATNLTRWQLDVNTDAEGYENVRSGKIYVSHNVTNFELFYEPFYVAKDIAPAHDERFMGYGYTRNTQVYEMFVAGYQFKVLSPVFTGHWGLQTRKGRPAWRERQNSNNRKHFESFKREIFVRYQKEPLKQKKG